VSDCASSREKPRHPYRELILLDSMALYAQTVGEVVRNYPREMLNQEQA